MPAFSTPSSKFLSSHSWSGGGDDDQDRISDTENSQSMIDYLQYHHLSHIDYFRPHDFQDEFIQGLRKLAEHWRIVYNGLLAFSALSNYGATMQGWL